MIPHLTFGENIVESHLLNEMCEPQDFSTFSSHFPLRSFLLAEGLWVHEGLCWRAGNRILTHHECSSVPNSSPPELGISSHSPRSRKAGLEESFARIFLLSRVDCWPLNSSPLARETHRRQTMLIHTPKGHFLVPLT